MRRDLHGDRADPDDGSFGHSPRRLCDVQDTEIMRQFFPLIARVAWYTARSAVLMRLSARGVRRMAADWRSQSVPTKSGGFFLFCPICHSRGRT
jgi:hypothetical protein